MGQTCYFILSIDGGGIRGRFALRFLRALERECPGFLDSVDMFAGVSTGAIVAAGLACGMSLADIDSIYRHHGARIFRQRAGSFPRGALEGMYSLDTLDAVLRAELGDRVFGDVNRDLVIGTHRVFVADDARQAWTPKYFHNMVAAEGHATDADLREPLVPATVASCAGPTYFPAVPVNKSRPMLSRDAATVRRSADSYLIDGGVHGNSPALSGVAAALDPRVAPRWRARPGVRPDLSQICVLSIGTGRWPGTLPPGVGSGGWAAWQFRLINLLMEGTTDATDFQAAQILGDRYMRWNVLLPEAIDLDEVADTERVVAELPPAGFDPLVVPSVCVVPRTMSVAEFVQRISL